MKYNIYVSVEMSGRLEIEADSLQEAEEKALESWELSDLDIDNVEVGES